MSLGGGASTVKLGTVNIAFHNDTGLSTVALGFEPVAEVNTVGVTTTNNATTKGGLVVGVLDREEDVVKSKVLLDLRDERLERLLKMDILISQKLPTINKKNTYEESDFSVKENPLVFNIGEFGSANGLAHLQNLGMMNIGQRRVRRG